MTEKIARRGARVLAEYAADFLDQVLVRDAASRDPVTLAAAQSLDAARSFLQDRAASKHHNGFPVIDGAGALVGVVTRADLLLDDRTDGSLPLRGAVKRAPVVIFEDSSLREAADRMVTEGVGRLVVVARADPARPLGILTRSDILGAHRRRLDEAQRTHVHLPLAKLLRRASREHEGNPPLSWDDPAHLWDGSAPEHVQGGERHSPGSGPLSPPGSPPSRLRSSFSSLRYSVASDTPSTRAASRRSPSTRSSVERINARSKSVIAWW